MSSLFLENSQNQFAFLAVVLPAVIAVATPAVNLCRTRGDL
jgi:hypothetical protein